jgi:hypothetical protein
MFPVYITTEVIFAPPLFMTTVHIKWNVTDADSSAVPDTPIDLFLNLSTRSSRKPPRDARWITAVLGDYWTLTLIQTASGVHPTSYIMGSVGSFPEGKAAGAWSWPLTSN